MIIAQKNESFVLIGNEPSRLRYPKIVGDMKLYKYDDNHNVIQFEYGKDYCVEDGCIVRKSDKIPDYRSSPFYNKTPFNHEKMATFGNDPYMVYADYEAEVDIEDTVDFNAEKIAEENGNRGVLSSFFKRFKKPVMNLLVFGDSISEGGGTTDLKYAYFSRLKDYIEKNYPFKANLTNKAIGGESSIDGIRRYKEVITSEYDLMILAYGMNDQVLDENGNQYFTPENYYENLKTMTEYALENNVETILVSPCLSNPRWVHSSPVLDKFVDRVKQLSVELHIPYADIYDLWKKELQYKGHSDLLQNDINHPSDFGHYIYFTEFKALIK